MSVPHFESTNKNKFKKSEKMKYCNNCEQYVEPTKKFNVCLFIILLFTLVGWFVYLIYYFCKTKKCPMCNSKNWGVKPKQSQPSYQRASLITTPDGNFKYCNQCGEKIGSNIQFCNLCGAKQNN